MGAPQYEQAGADIGGTGTTNTIPRWTGPSTLGDSGLIDNGTAIYTTTRNVGIGTAGPLAKLHTLISGTAVVSAGSDPAPGTLFEGTNTALTTGATSTQQLAIMSNSAVAADAGGGLVLGGKYTGNAYANFAAIKSGKDNATGAEYGGYLAFYTRTNGQAGVGERARIDSSGNFGIGNASPSSYEAGATQLVVGSGTGAQGITIAGSSDNNIYFATSTSGANKYRGFLRYAVASDALVIGAGSSERARVDSNGNVVINTAAIATNATNGFLYVPSCAGTPTGTPTTYTGRVPIVVDTTNNKLYFYSGGAWRDAGP